MKRISMVERLMATMLLCTVFMGSGCSNSSGDDVLTTEETTTATTVEIQVPKPEINNYNGYEFRIFTPEHNKNKWFDADEINGDTLYDAVYERNLQIEEEYNVNISVIVSPTKQEAVGHVLKNVQADDDFADITTLAFYDFFPVARQGFYVNWYDVDGIMLHEDWWDQTVYKQLDIGNKIYTLVGDFSTDDELSTFVIMYNKELYNNYGFKNAYEVVEAGKWTFDMLWEQATAVSEDIDGDGKMTVNDRFGLLAESGAYNYIYSGAGYYSIDIVDDGYNLNIGTERCFDIVEKLSVIATEKYKHSLVVDDNTVEGMWDTGYKMFTSGQGLFYTGSLNNMVAMRDIEGDFGVLPIPKYEESQDRYYNLASMGTMSAQMPVTVSEYKRTANILDAICNRSTETVHNKLYNVLLNGKAMRDEESTRMLDIIFETKGYNLDYCASITGFTNLLAEIAITGENHFASKYAAIQNSVKIKVEEFLADFAN